MKPNISQWYVNHPVISDISGGTMMPDCVSFAFCLFCLMNSIWPSLRCSTTTRSSTRRRRSPVLLSISRGLFLSERHHALCRRSYPPCVVRFMCKEAEPWTPALCDTTQLNALLLRRCVLDLQHEHFVEAHAPAAAKSAVTEKYADAKYHAASAVKCAGLVALQASFLKY